MTAPAFFYATETGNAETVARQAHARAVAGGRTDATVANLSTLSPADLAPLALAFFVVSTWGDGEPPSDAAGFFYALEKARIDLSGLRYAVLGLGDRDYSDFCGFARRLDERLAALGARPVLARAEAGLDYEETCGEWTGRLLPLIEGDAVAN